MGVRRASQPTTPAAGFFGQPDGARFGIVSADPPWPWETWGEVQGRGDRRAEKHYDTMSLAEIGKMPIGELAAKDCALFVWATGPHLPNAIEAIDAWGFKYSGLGFVWIKTRAKHDRPFLNPTFDLHFGMGKTTRHNAEICLLAFRGSPTRLSTTVPEVIVAPVREHSRKPDVAAERMMELYGGPAVELFARERRAGWACWSNEIDRFSDDIGPMGKPTWYDARSASP